LLGGHISIALRIAAAFYVTFEYGIGRRRWAMYPFPQTSQTIPWTELPPADPNSPLAAEWETYRREVGPLLAEGQEGKFALIKGEEIIGIYETWDEARRAGLEKYLLEPHTARPILSREPLIRGPLRLRLWQR
jgi:hypothetical protein